MPRLPLMPSCPAPLAPRRADACLPNQASPTLYRAHTGQSRHTTTQSVWYALRTMRWNSIADTGSTHLANSFKSARGEFHAHHLAKGVREEPFALDVGQPRPTCLFLRERDAVPILLCLSVEQAELGPLEGLAQRRRERRWKRGEHASWSTRR